MAHVFPIFLFVPNISYIEHSWCFHIIPIFLRKWIHHFLLGFLSVSFPKVLVLANAMLREPQSCIVRKQLLQYRGSDCLFFTVIGYKIGIFLYERELVSDCFILIWGNNLSFTYDVWRHKQEVTRSDEPHLFCKIS